MLRDGVLRAIPTKQGALVYGPGPRFDQFLPSQAS
jgi:hypothetical protein